MMNTQELSTLLCKTLCTSAEVSETKPGLWQVQTSFYFPDGDAYVLYVQELASGVRVSDMGMTMMRLSYDHDLRQLQEGKRGRIFEQILAETGVREDDGEFFVDSPVAEIGASFFKMGQAMTRIHDLSLFDRVRTENTFYEDLEKVLHQILQNERVEIVSDYIVPNIPNAQEYPVDYFLRSQKTPVYLFGVPNKDKARFATIVLQHLLMSEHQFSSIVVFQNMSDLPRHDVSRLTNAADVQIDSLAAQADLKRKLHARLAA